MAVTPCQRVGEAWPHACTQGRRAREPRAQRLACQTRVRDIHFAPRRYDHLRLCRQEPFDAAAVAQLPRFTTG